jgi:HD-GYP domain-containing protein (c-di-GMP phosphodiesterase class II)
MWVRRTETKSERDEGLDWRVGVKMLDPIPPAALDAFQNGGQKTRKATEALLDSDILSPEFQAMLQVEVDRTLKKMKQRPALAKYLQQLEILRGQDSYLAEHIQVLTVVCTFIARTMNWVSEASMEKFVYAAYMHDAPLFAHPRLAPLRSRADLESHKAQLTAEEVDIFLRAPDDAAKAALADSSAPPDVAAMLSMQKELPDGSGFPRGLNQAKISPMAALFIIAHSLTDAIMDDNNWRMDEWLKKAKGQYRGGNFNKILAALDDVKITLKRR